MANDNYWTGRDVYLPYLGWTGPDVERFREAMRGHGAPNDLVFSGSGSVVSVGGPLPVQVKVLPHGAGLELPSYGTPDSVGLDLRAACAAGGKITIPGGSAHKIPTGLAFAIPSGYAGLVLSRSGLAAKHRVAITNAPGLVDPDYRGEVFLLLENRGPYPFEYERGDRLGQLLIVPAPRVALQVVAELEDTVRGEGGLGSTGVAS